LSHRAAVCHLLAEAAPAKSPKTIGMPYVATRRNGSTTC
jgi:hypothetical protein